MANPSHHVPTGAAAAEPPPRFTLRQLPLPAKLVLSTFLLAVGVGYTSAMVQLHMQHSERDGEPLPTKDNVIAVFAGKRWVNSPAEYTRAIGRLELLILGEPGGAVTPTNMAPAFFAGDGGGKTGYANQAKDAARKPKLDEEREGERKALLAWINAPAEERKAAYDADAFTLPGDPAKQIVSPEFVAGRAGVVKIKSIIDARCVRCHGPDGAQAGFPLTSYAQLAKPTYIPENEVVPEGGGWVSSGRKVSLEKLTQSTHAHLLSFAMLYALTGLVFAFSGFPTIIRAFVAPLALVAQVADIACWWLAWRLDPPYGPNCATAILVTGGVVGLSLGAHIVLSLFSMYGPTGKGVLLVLFAAAAGGGAALWKGEIAPALQRQKDEAAAKAADLKKQAEDLKAAAGKKDQPAQEKKADPTAPNKTPEVPAAGPSEFERLLSGSWKTAVWPKDRKKGDRLGDGAMVQAFFKQEADFKAALKDDPKEAEKLVPQREGERDGLLAWVKAAPDVRKKAFDENKFALPEALAGKATPEFTDADGKLLKVQTLIETRCLGCHADGSKNGSLEKYEDLSRYFVPRAKE